MMWRLAGIRLLACLLCMGAVAIPVYATEPKESDSSAAAGAPECEQMTQYVFSWPLLKGCGAQVRGGTTQGVAVTLDGQPYQGWLSLQDKDITDFERDRRAILAMAGPYRANFEFLEVMGYVPEFVRDKPYQSWGTEYVYVVEDKGDFISLQHIMVMFFEDDEGAVSGPMVMKHWRQDWQYQKRAIFNYVGDNTWVKKKLTARERKGSWAQAVYQVDDAPRYESFGRWEHKPNFSTWKSAETWRPLPRREHSVRDDYHVLEGTNRHTIVPNGWVHEEENYKVVLKGRGQLADHQPYLAKELGVNRYDRIVGHDFSAGDQYWRRTGPFWADVRAYWNGLIARHKRIVLKDTVDSMPLFMRLFDYAERMEDYDARASRRFVRETIDPYVEAE